MYENGVENAKSIIYQYYLNSPIYGQYYKVDNEEREVTQKAISSNAALPSLSSSSILDDEYL